MRGFKLNLDHIMIQAQSPPSDEFEDKHNDDDEYRTWRPWFGSQTFVLKLLSTSEDNTNGFNINRVDLFAPPL